MARRRTHVPLGVYLNNRHIGRLDKDASGAIAFSYAPDWLAWEHAMPVSLSLPLRETAYKGAPVAAVFENLLPDNDAIRKRVAEHVGAEGTDSYSMLTKIGRDCVGALQFLPDDQVADASGKIEGVPVSDADVESILSNLARTPLGLDEDDEFRISVAGAQEKTALLWHDNRWYKPTGTTPTTHILKPQIGEIQTSGGMIDLSNSVENEYYCLKLLELFGLEVNPVEIMTYGTKKVLVVERFDRRWTNDNRLIRLPQEDCCQALSVPPGRKYQSHGGPGIVSIAGLLKGSDTPLEDQADFFKAQILFWLLGATDGHAKNFSVFIQPGGRYRLTPFYDVLTTQPSLDAGQIRKNAFKLAMSVGDKRHYRVSEIAGRHFRQSAKEAGLGAAPINKVFDEIITSCRVAFDKLEEALPEGFPMVIHESVKAAALSRLKLLEATA